MIYSFLEKNLLCGEIPEELANASNLDLLYLNENKLSGDIPQTLLELPLTEAVINDNYLTESSHIPSSWSIKNAFQRQFRAKSARSVYRA